MAQYYCKICGHRESSVDSLIRGYCQNSRTGKHILYEGGEKSEYTCKICGHRERSLDSLVYGYCQHSRTGKHQPAL